MSFTCTQQLLADMILQRVPPCFCPNMSAPFQLHHHSPNSISVIITCNISVHTHTSCNDVDTSHRTGSQCYKHLPKRSHPFAVRVCKQRIWSLPQGPRTLMYDDEAKDAILDNVISVEGLCYNGWHVRVCVCLFLMSGDKSSGHERLPQWHISHTANVFKMIKWKLLSMNIARIWL